MKYRGTMSLLLFIALMQWACTKTVPVVGQPFSESESRFFDDGIDVIQDYSTLTGQFGFDAREELDARSNLADVIALVSITSVQTNEMAAEGSERRVNINIDKVLYGQFPQRAFQLRSVSSSLGFSLLERHEAQLSGQQLLFLRTFSNAGGISHHFHLSPASSVIVKAVTVHVKKRVDAEKAAKEKDD